jgi:formiminotetrahydrofolate cyclodeaminase
MKPANEDHSFGRFLRELSSGEGLPGSGAAGALALALAAGCAAKAAALSLKRFPDNEALSDARTKLLRCMEQALQGSDEDAERFAQFLRRRDSDAAERVIAADRSLLDLVDAINAMIDQLDPQVRHDVVGDLVAARALSEAARAIQAHNISEMQQRRPT